MKIIVLKNHGVGRKKIIILLFNGSVLILFSEVDSLKLNIMHNLEEQFNYVDNEIIISESF